MRKIPGMQRIAAYMMEVCSVWEIIDIQILCCVNFYFIVNWFSWWHRCHEAGVWGVTRRARIIILDEGKFRMVEVILCRVKDIAIRFMMDSKKLFQAVEEVKSGIILKMNYWFVMEIHMWFMIDYLVRVWMRIDKSFFDVAHFIEGEYGWTISDRYWM